MKIAVLASGSGSNLQAILDQQQAGNLRINIALVVSDVPGAHALTRAERAGIDRKVIDPHEFENRQQWTAALVAALREAGIQLVVLAGFMRIVDSALLEAFPGRVLNIHPSLLPRYRGLDTYRRALEAGDSHHGTSVHFVTEELDGGPVIAQARLPIGDDRDPKRLKVRVQAAEHWLYPRVIAWFAADRLAMRAGAAWLDGTRLSAPRVFSEAGQELPAAHS